MKKLNNEPLFLAIYPTSKNITDGMFMRIDAVDSLFRKEKRVYLHVSLKDWKSNILEKDNAVIYNLNLFRNFWKIRKIVKSHKNIYSHSIYESRFMGLWMNKKKQNITLDLHGVVPEEEKYFHKRGLNSLFYKFVEKQLFNKISNVICVTNKMKEIYQKRYKKDINYLVYNIIPNSVSNSNETLESEKINPSDKIEILYCGGIQGWQNVPLMLDFIKKNSDPTIHFTILTGDENYFLQESKKLNIPEESLTIKRVHPSKLHKYYRKMDYALIFRDDNIVNNVASPTKLFEYLYYGLIPIVLSPNIGDYKDLGYEYIEIDNFEKNKLIKNDRTNSVNKKIARTLIDNNKLIDLYDFVIGRK